MKSEFASDVFANPKDDSFESSVNQIYQTFGGNDCYPTLEEKAAMLLYLITKNHSFSDGNKRIAASCFLYFLEKNGILYKNKALLGEFIQASFRSSAAVLGIAFIQNIYGTSGMAPLMIIGTVPLYNVAAVLILSLTGPSAHGLDKASLKKTLKGVVTNPIIIGIFLGMFASILRINFPVMIDKTLHNIASLASPLALLGLGAGFEGKKALKQIPPTAVATALKLIILPAIFLPVAISMGFTGEKLVAILVMLGSPATASCYIMAKNMGHEGTLTSSVVVATTFLSSVTLTGFLFVLRSMGVI